MSYKYDSYLSEHIQNVKNGYDWLLQHFPEIDEKMNGNQWIFGVHDASKYETEEYEAYDKYFYGGNKSYKVVKDFKLAWLHHIHNNPHHWQYWILQHDDEPEEILEMPYCYVIEMICDWWSFSWKENKLDEILKWYEKHKDMKLHPNTRKLVEDILSKIENIITSDETYLEHHGIKGQKWGVLNGPPYPIGSQLKNKTPNNTISEKDLKNTKSFNASKWGEDENHNVLYITGYSGSGKSTLAKTIADRNNSNVIHLDGFTEYGAKDEDDIRDRDFVKYLNKNMKDWKNILLSSPDNEKPPIEPYSKKYFSLVDEFKDNIVRFSKEKYNEGKSVIVEGIQLMDDWWDGSEYNFKGQPFIIMTTNKLISAKRAFDRDDRDIFNIENWKTALKNAKSQKETIQKILNKMKNGEDEQQ